MLRRISKVLLTLVIALSVVAAYGFTPAQDAYALAKAKTPKVTSVSLNHKVITIKKGKTVKLKATVLPKKAAKKAKLIWSTSKKKVATVKSGKVKAAKKKTGKVTITVKVKGTKKKAKCTVYVGTPVTKAVLKQSAVTLTKGETASAGASVTPKKATVKKILYTSSDKTVATVDKNGKITAVGGGTAVITAKPQDEAGKAAKLNVTVVVPVSGVSFDAAEKTIEKGQSFTLAATVEPADATNKAVTFTSSDAKVASVNDSGVVTAVGRGTADITVKTADGEKTASCKVKVTFPKEMVISKVEEITKELIEAVKSGEVEKIFIKGDNDINIEIPKEDLSKSALVVDAPKGHIENYANFKNIDINAISSTTFVEHAQGNTINYAASTGSVKVAEGAVAEVSVNSGAGSLALVNDGSISELNINTRASVDISGSSGQSIQTNIAQGAANASVSTSLSLNVNAAAPANVTIREGAEDSTFEVANASSMPSIRGLSRFEVMNNETGESSFIVATNDGTSGITVKTVTLAGDVSDVNNDPVSGANVYAIPYTGKLTTAEVGRLVSKAAGKGTTASDGSYTIPNVTAGNYYILVQKSGYADYSATSIITTSNAATFNVPEVTLIEASSASKTGTLSGSLIDSVTGEAVESGLTVMLREGGNNISGDVLQTTTTDGDGHYSFGTAVKLGQYTVQVVDKRTNADKHYITTSFDALVSSEGVNVVNSTLSYTLDSEQVRFVLTWGNEQSGASADIDSHLVGPKASGDGHFHTWYSDMHYNEWSGDQVTTYADLDRDDVDYEGPETTTIYMKSKGVYSFYVHDFTNRGETAGCTQLAKSSAVVKIYVGKTLKKQFSVPNKEGILWHVCDYDMTTNKITERNTMGYWPSEELESIGLDPADLAKIYQERLAEAITKAEKYIGQMKDDAEIKADGQKAVSNAKANKNSTDLGVLRENLNVVNNWISEAESPLYFSVRGDSIYEYYNEETGDLRLLRIVGYTDTLPEFTVEPDYADTVCEIKASDKSGYEKMVVVTAATGVSRTCYITYEKTKYGVCIADIESNNEDFIITHWYSGSEDEEDQLGDSVLEIYGVEETAPADMLSYLDITAYDKAADVKVTGDAPGFDGKVVITSGGNSRTYFIKYVFDINYALSLRDITTDELLNEEDEDSETLIAWTDIEMADEDDADYGYAYIYLNGEKVPTTITPVLRSSLSSAEITTSDKDSDAKMIVVSYKNYTRKYYISYDYTDWVKFGIKANQKDNPQITDWEIDYMWDEGTEDDIRILHLTGFSESLPADLKITTISQDSSAVVTDSDRSGFDKMVVVTFRDSSTKYYIRYTYDENAVEEVLTIDSVEVMDAEGSSLAYGNSCWYDDGNNIYLFYIDGTVSELTPDMDFRVNLTRDGATYEVLASDLEEYPAIIRVSCGDVSRDYYVSYYYEQPYEPEEHEKFDFSEVYLHIDGENIVNGYITYVWYDEDENELWGMDLRGDRESVTDEEILSGLSVYMYNDEVSVSIEESDKDGYACKLVLTDESEGDEPETRVYYVKYVQNEE